MRRHFFPCLALVVLLTGPQTLAAREAAFTFVESDSATANVTIDLGQVSDYRVADGLFGKFTESLARNVYGGFWAQALENPSLESIETCVGRNKYKRDELQRTWELTHRNLPGQIDLRNMAYGWFAWNGRDAEYRLAGQAYNTSHCQMIEVEKLAGGVPGVGICQPMYLPTRRTQRYRLSLYARNTNAPIIAVVVDARQPDTVLGQLVLEPANSANWQRRSGLLTLDVSASERPRPLMFCLGLATPGTAHFDQVTLFPDDCIDGFDPEVIALSKASRVSVLRFPGGNYVSGYHWKDDLTPLDKRPTMQNPAWPEYDPHYVGTDEHIRLCQLIGAEPLICVNAGDGTPQEAADWLEYCNGDVHTKWGKIRAERGHPEPYNVRLWEIGNELWGDWQIGHCSAEEYPARYRAFHDAMKAVDPTITVIACGNKGDYQPGWNEALVERCGDILESLSVHMLFFNSPDAAPEYSYINQIGYSHVVEDMFRSVHATGAARGLDLNVAVTECFQATMRAYHARFDQLSEVVFYAGTVNSAIRTQGIVDIITHTALVNLGGGLRREFGTVYANPVYYARAELQKLAGAQPVSCRVRALFSDIPDWQAAWAGSPPKRFPLVDAMPLLRDGELTVVLLNRHPRDALPIDIALEHGKCVSQRVRLWELTGKSWHAMNDAIEPTRVTPRVRSISTNDDGNIRLEARPASLYILRMTVEPSP